MCIFTCCGARALLFVEGNRSQSTLHSVSFGSFKLFPLKVINRRGLQSGPHFHAANCCVLRTSVVWYRSNVSSNVLIQASLLNITGNIFSFLFFLKGGVGVLLQKFCFWTLKHYKCGDNPLSWYTNGHPAGNKDESVDWTHGLWGQWLHEATGCVILLMSHMVNEMSDYSVKFSSQFPDAPWNHFKLSRSSQDFHFTLISCQDKLQILIFSENILPSDKCYYVSCPWNISSCGSKPVASYVVFLHHTLVK